MEILRTTSAVAGMCAAHSALRKKNLYNKNNRFDVCMKKMRRKILSKTCTIPYDKNRKNEEKDVQNLSNQLKILSIQYS